MHVVGLDKEIRKRRINSVSGSEQQRIEIVRPLLTNPKVILADEPTGSLDLKNTQKFMSYLKKVTQDNDVSVVIVTHDPEVYKYCDVVYRIEEGKVKAKKVSNNGECQCYIA